MAHEPRTSTLYGLLAEFNTTDALLAAVRKTRAAGYTKIDAYSPFPIHGMADALNFHDRLVAPIVLGGGIMGAAVGYGLQYWSSVIEYPMNVGSRPFHAWVSFIPPAFETTILFAAFAAVFGMLALNGLPRPYHPVFNAERFSRVTQDKFFLAIEAADPKFDRAATGRFLSSLTPREVVELEE